MKTVARSCCLAPLLCLTAFLQGSASAQFYVPIKTGVEPAKLVDNWFGHVRTFDYRDPLDRQGPSTMGVVDFYFTGNFFTELSWKSSNGYEFWVVITDKTDSEVYFVSELITEKSVFVEFDDPPADGETVHIHLWTWDWLNGKWIPTTHSANVFRTFYIDG